MDIGRVIDRNAFLVARSVIIMDDASIHCNARIEELS